MDGQRHFNHIAFKVRNVHEVIGGGQFIAQRGWETQAGPGRHYVSSACFWYFKSPLGGAAEYAADEDVVTAKWKARTHQLTPEIFSEWTFNVPADKKLAGAPISAAAPRPDVSAAAISMLDEELEQAVTVSEEHRVLAGGELVARPRQTDIDRFGDTAGIRRERDDAIAEIDRFLEIVGDEHDGDALLLGEARNFVL